MTGQRKSFRPSLGRLEDRACPSAVAVTASLSARVLTVHGTDGPDVIHVEKSGADIKVAGRRFAAGGVSLLVVVGEGGSDAIYVSQHLAVTTRIYGNGGNDVISGGGGIDGVFGGSGDDALYGQAGNDVLFGGDGADRLNGGSGANIVAQGAPGRARTVMTAIETEIVTLTNRERVRRGLRPLTVSPLLNNAAHLHSANMAARRRMAHDLERTLLPTTSSRFDFVGYSASAWAESVAYGYTSAREVVSAWMSSPGHRANILSPALRDIGVGVVRGGDGGLYFTQLFGTRL